jgi:hypothetical protein
VNGSELIITGRRAGVVVPFLCVCAPWHPVTRATCSSSGCLTGIPLRRVMLQRRGGFWRRVVSAAMLRLRYVCVRCPCPYARVRILATTAPHFRNERSGAEQSVKKVGTAKSRSPRTQVSPGLAPAARQPVMLPLRLLQAKAPAPPALLLFSTIPSILPHYYTTSPPLPPRLYKTPSGLHPPIAISSLILLSSFLCFSPCPLLPPT